MSTAVHPPQETFRNYVDSAHQDRVEALYKEKYTKQTFDYATRIKQEYGTFNRGSMTIMEAAALLDSIVDESDPDSNVSQINHAIQTGEACRRARPDLDWFHLLGFIHDLGKILASPKFGSLAQWEMVGDTFPVGCRMTDANVLIRLASENPDMQDPKYNTELGVYEPHCGFDKVTWAFGHDEYFYMVLRNHPENRLPEEAMYCIRFHSFYPWHNKGGYTYLANEQDNQMLPWVQTFQKCDLYSKENRQEDWDALKPYYQSLVDKYIPGLVRW